MRASHTSRLTRALAAATGATVLVLGHAVPGQAATVDRIAGDDRIATGLAVYEWNRPVFTSDTVVLTRADQFPDALAAAPLAAALRAPVLATFPRAIDARVLAAMKRQKVERVVIVGGTSAVSEAAARQLRAASFTVDRIAGSDRFTTAEAVAKTTANHLPVKRVPVYVADGLKPHDALIAGAVAGSRGGVVLLSAGRTLKPSTRELVGSTMISGRSGVGDAGTAALQEFGLPESVVGSTPEVTSANAGRWWYRHAPSVVVASSRGWADALSAAPLAALTRAPLLLVGPGKLTPQTRSYLGSISATKATVLGGQSAVAPSVATQVGAAMPK